MRSLGFVLVFAACATTTATPGPVREYPGELRPPSAFGDDFMMRQKIEAEFGDDDLSFEAVLQKVGDKLTLLGFTPFGSRAFLLEQTGTDVKFTTYVDRALPFPPKYILLDIQRTLYVGASHEDGTHQLDGGPEVVTETWSGGKLMRREVVRKDGKPTGTLKIQYEGGMPPGEPPPKIHFDNGWFGYSLAIHTLERKKL